MQNYDTYSERERKMPHVGCVPFGPVQTFPRGVTEVAQTLSDKRCALATKVKRKPMVWFAAQWETQMACKEQNRLHHMVLC